MPFATPDPRNPFSQLRFRRAAADLVVLTKPELALLVRTAETVWEEFGRSMSAPLITVPAATGLRPGELYGLHWPDVDFAACELQVLRQRQSRTGEEVLPGGRVRRQRVVVLPGEAADALRRVPKHGADDHVFWTPGGEPFTTRTFGYYWRPIRAAFLVQLVRAGRRRSASG